MDRYKYPKKPFFEFLHRFLGVFVPVPKAKKWYFLDLVPVQRPQVNLIFHIITGTKSEKYHFFAFGTGTKTPRNRCKKFKKSFFGYLYHTRKSKCQY
jgi:hypothetical protein